MKKIEKYGLKVSSTLLKFINNEVIPGTNLKIEEFGMIFQIQFMSYHQLIKP